MLATDCVIVSCKKSNELSAGQIEEDLESTKLGRGIIFVFLVEE